MKERHALTPENRPTIMIPVALTAVTAAFIIVLLNVSSDPSIILINTTFTVYFFLLSAYLLICARWQIKRQPYSYNTVFYLGFSIFMLVISGYLTYVSVTLNSMRNVPEIDAEVDVSLMLAFITESDQAFSVLSFPLFILLSVALTISNIQLIRKEGLRFVNILGIILAVMLIGGGLVHYIFNDSFSGSMKELLIHETISKAFTTCLIYFECLLLGVIVSNIIVNRRKVPENVGAIIILGCGIRQDGTPTPLLKGRVDKAVSIYNEHTDTSGEKPFLIPSGGQGPDEVISEAQSMKDYLMTLGIPEDNILTEDQSVSTYQNMLFSKKIIDEHELSDIVFVTNNYHLFRSGIFSADVGMKAHGAGAKTKGYFWPNAAVREFVGMLSKQRKKQALILLVLLALNIGSSLAFYLFV